MTSTLSIARQIFPPLLGLRVNACILQRERLLFAFFNYAYNYKNACIVSELSKTNTIKEYL